LFIGAFINESNSTTPRLIGFITSTQSDSDLVTEEAMSSHDPSGKAVCIYSVCTHPDFRGKGVASKLIKHYIEWIRNLKNEGVLCVDRICLMSRAKLSDWYSKLGFEYIGKSEVQHGKLAIFLRYII
jgi:GNAT superfamily N-acetyltransferase